GRGQTGTEPEKPATEDLTISAAVSLKEAFDEIGNAYAKSSGRRINFNYGSSGALQRQIENGAPIDVFASAGEKQIEELGNAGFIEVTTRRNFAMNSIVLIVPAVSNKHIRSFEDLRKIEVEKVAIGNPKTVPAGKYAEEALRKFNLAEAVASKLVLAENVRQVLTYVERGEVDAGIVYSTDLRSADGKVTAVAAAADASHSPILYPIALVRDGRNKRASQDFVDFVLSREGQKILEKFGFKPAIKK
ncbi:MAG: molybdate ABC transporter substrate-binding protein, partial [Acidobacteria bacterium]|nr:molybdate ABC transporter substrate-binding protein [Acidobacteriota bacterium]